MVEKGKKEKHEEQVQFAAYKQFCDDTTVEKQRAKRRSMKSKFSSLPTSSSAMTPRLKSSVPSRRPKKSRSMTKTFPHGKAISRQPLRFARLSTLTMSPRTRITQSQSTLSMKESPR